MNLAVVALAVALLLGACAPGGDLATRLHRADAAVARGDTARAIQLLKGAVHSDDATPALYARMGRLYCSKNTIVDRLRAQALLEEGLQRFPDDIGILMELGKTYYVQTFYPDAARCFTSVLEMDGEHCEAHYYLGRNWFRKWRHIQVYSEYLASARAHFQRTTRCDSDNRDALYKFAFSSYVLGDSTGAIRACESLLARDSAAPEASFLLGVIAFEHDDFEGAVARFNSSFLLLSEEEREHFADIALLLDEEQLEEYEYATEEKRRDMQRIFWAESNPDPTSRVNVRYVEHVYRMVLADAFYELKRPALRGWETERGKALVKFGRPATIGTTLAGEFLSGRKEIWKYGSGELGFTFVFMDEFLNGNYMVPMDYRYSSIAQALYLDEPVSSYVSPYESVPGVLDVFSFRDRSSASVYLALKIDMDSLEYHMDLDGAGGLVARTSFFDREWRQTFYYEDTLSVDPIRRQTDRGAPWYYLVKDYDLPFDYHRVAFSLVDDTERGQALVQAETNTLSYLSDSLALSDILLYRGAQDTGDFPALVRRGDKQFLANPGGAYAQAEKLRLYVEIYNLRVPGPGAEYEVTYSIYDPAADSPTGWARLKKGVKSMMGFRSESEPVISQTLERKSFQHRSSEDLAIDIGTLRAGDYVLNVAVRDRISGEIAQRSTAFTKESVPQNR
jgi:GWxTD domain-containing protein